MTEQRDYQKYDVALWLQWPSLFPEYVDDVYALNSKQAVLSLMEREALKQVKRAGVQSPNGKLEFWQYVDIESLRDGEVSIVARLVWKDGRIVSVPNEPNRTESEVMS